MNSIRRLIALAALCLLASGCQISTSRQIDEGKAEEVISQSLTERFGTDVESVECPEREAEKGDVFTCEAMIGGQPLEIEVTQTSDEGDIEAEPAQAVIDVAKAERAMAEDLSKQLATTVTVECGDESVVIRRPGEAFTCEGSDSQGGRAQIKVTVKDVDGNIDFETV